MINKHEVEALKKYLNENTEDSPRIARSFLEDSIPALEKQIQKKPVQGEPFNWVDSVKIGRKYKEVKKTSYGHACPVCGNSVAQLSNKYCSKCGQALDWKN